MEVVNDEVGETLKIHLNSADRWSDWFRNINIALAVIIAGLGSVLAASELLNSYVAMALGALTAMFGALNKALDPGKRAERNTLRKRALELIKIELECTDRQSRLSNDDAKRLIHSAKHDPTTVLEEMIRFQALKGVESEK